MSCLYYLEVQQEAYVDFVSALQLFQVIRNYEDWEFAVYSQEPLDVKIKQGDFLKLGGYEALKKSIFVLEEPEDVYVLFDGNIRLDSDTSNSKGDIQITRSTYGMLQILVDANALAKPKTKTRGNGVKFSAADFLVKIGSVKKGPKNFLFILISWTLLATIGNHLSQPQITHGGSREAQFLPSLKDRYLDFLRQLLELGKLPPVSLEEQVTRQTQYMSEWKQLNVGEALLISLVCACFE